MTALDQCAGQWDGPAFQRVEQPSKEADGFSVDPLGDCGNNTGSFFRGLIKHNWPPFGQYMITRVQQFCRLLMLMTLPLVVVSVLGCGGESDSAQAGGAAAGDRLDLAGIDRRLTALGFSPHRDFGFDEAAEFRGGAVRSRRYFMDGRPLAPSVTVYLDGGSAFVGLAAPGHWGPARPSSENDSARGVRRLLSGLAGRSVWQLQRGKRTALAFEGWLLERRAADGVFVVYRQAAGADQ